MWVNILLFVVGLTIAAYFYMTRKFGTFLAHGIPEYEPCFPWGSQKTKEIFTAQTHFTRQVRDCVTNCNGLNLILIPYISGHAKRCITRLKIIKWLGVSCSASLL